MAQSQLTVRTLGLATIALALACVHAATADTRSGVASFSSTKGKAAARGSSVATVKGDPWKQTAEVRTVQTQPRAKGAPSQAARNAAQKARLDAARAKSGYRPEPICVVRRAGAPKTAAPARPISTAAAPRPSSIAAAPPRSEPLRRNAFAISATMAQSAP